MADPWCKIHAAPGCLRALSRSFGEIWLGRVCADCPPHGKPETIAADREWRLELLKQASGMSKDEARELLQQLPEPVFRAVADWFDARTADGTLDTETAQRALEETLVIEALRRRSAVSSH